jgi:malate synthase
MVKIGDLMVSEALAAFVETEALPGTKLTAAEFWQGASAMIRDFTPRIQEALARRTELQLAIDSWHANSDALADADAYERFLRDIGYLVQEPETFAIATEGVDREISSISGPQLVVPLSNARFAVNAANARWGSMYDAFYGSDVIDEDGDRGRGSLYNPVRGAEVIRRGRTFLDDHVPLLSASHAEVTRYAVVEGALSASIGVDSAVVGLADPGQLAGFQGPPEAPTSILLLHHGLHLEIRLDPEHPVGRTDRANVSDIVLESAITTIMDLEDSVAAVDAVDKVHCYRNWLHLMQGRLEAIVEKGDWTFVRTMAEDRTYTKPAGGEITLPGRSLLLVRQVGHLMSSDAIVDADGQPVPEGIIDSLMTAIGSLHDLQGPGAGRNSRAGKMYVVKPKLHGPHEVALACDILARAEVVVGLPPLTMKIGIMDEERRTSANLKACIMEARDRIAFINTGFLDRTGDEIHTSIEAGPVARKGDMKAQTWIKAYEDSNVDIALECGFQGRAQIGKGMWAAPDNMAQMLREKRQHPEAGASCAWVPSPTAATMHAIHYHQVDVAARQAELAGRRRSTVRQLLTPPLQDPAEWTEDDRRHELDNNVQSTLGYVVRWIDAGVGCSKVPDLSGTPLMEDRATCRISSQHVANWLLHGVISSEDVEDSLRRMAVIVDGQNAADPKYRPMAPAYDGEAFLAARDLLLEGREQPSGYTEPILHRRRLALKRAEMTH